MYLESGSLVETDMPMGNGCGCPSSCSGSYNEGAFEVAQTTTEEEYTRVFEIQVHNDSYHII